jgi:Phage integrase family
MLYETAARASEILALDIDDLDLPARRASITSKGGDTDWVHWASGTAHLLPRLLRGRDHGPVFLSHRRPGLSRRPPAHDLCPHTGKARLGYDRARILLATYTGWELHQLRHSAASQLYLGGMNLFAIQELLGHAWTATTARYIHAAGGHRLAQPGPVPVGSGQAVIDVDPVGCDIKGREGVALGGEVLIVGGHPRVSDPELGHQQCRIASRHRHCSPNHPYGTLAPAASRDQWLAGGSAGGGSSCGSG